MRRTTIRLDEHLHAEVKRAAASSNRTMTSFIEDALRAALDRRESASSKPFKLVTFKGSGPAPGVDLDDSASLLERMETDRDAALYTPPRPSPPTRRR